MTVIAVAVGPWVLAAAAAGVLWLMSRGSDDAPPDDADPNAPDEHGFIPADKYGYGYGYSWGSPYGDPDL
ncbi:MAG TPA: hypothetical protein VM307_02090 [Egibacteraceae bacterium]|nr:hypothetical protein [Egibacteraceae bacterium]